MCRGKSETRLTSTLAGNFHPVDLPLDMAAAPSFHRIYLDPHDLVGPSLASGETLNNFPEKRKRLNLASILSGDSAKYELIKISAPVPLTLENTFNVHEEGLLRLFREGWDAWIALIGTRPGFTKDHGLKAVPVSVGREGEADGVMEPGVEYYMVPAQIAPKGVVTRTGNTVLGWITQYAQDKYTPICPRTGETLSRDLGVIRTAVSDILVNLATGAPPTKAFAMTTLPGHHSSSVSFGGYCYVNFAAVAAKMFRTKLDKVAIVDVDYHHGNGTMGIFWEDPNVLFASLHMHPDYDYPYCTGYEDETGPASGPAANTTITVPLMPGTVWSSYKTKLQHVLDRVAAFGAQAVVVSMGFDTLGGDREASDGAGMNLAPADFTEMGRMFTCLPIPVLYIQEGGYYLEGVAQAIAHLMDLK